MVKRNEQSSPSLSHHLWRTITCTILRCEVCWLNQWFLKYGVSKGLITQTSDFGIYAVNYCDIHVYGMWARMHLEDGGWHFLEEHRSSYHDSSWGRKWSINWWVLNMPIVRSWAGFTSRGSLIGAIQIIRVWVWKLLGANKGEGGFTIKLMKFHFQHSLLCRPPSKILGVCTWSYVFKFAKVRYVCILFLTESPQII